MGRWVHMPCTSHEYKYYAILCGGYEAMAYNCLRMISSESTKASFYVSLKYFAKVCIIYNLLGNKEESNVMANYIALISAELAKLEGNDVNAT